jgi:hypothetical protein
MDCGRVLTPTAIGRSPVIYFKGVPSCTPKAYPYARSVRSWPFIGLIILAAPEALAASCRSLAALRRSVLRSWMPMVAKMQVIAVFRPCPSDVIMNDTNSEGCGWLAGRRNSEESAQIADRSRSER